VTEAEDSGPKHLFAWLVALFEARTGVHLPSTDEMATERLREASQKAFAEWRAVPTSAVCVNLPFLTATAAGPIHLAETLQPRKAAAIFAGERFEDELAFERSARANAQREAAVAERAAGAGSRHEDAERARWTRIGVVVLGFLLALLAIAVASFLATRR